MQLTDRQINEAVSITLYVLYYIAATAFHFPLGRINMSLAAMWNLYTSDARMGALLHFSFSSTCFHSGLPRAVTEASGNSTESVTLANRIRGILPCPRDDSIGGVSAKAFFKVKHFWKTAGLLVNIYWCMYRYRSAVIAELQILQILQNILHLHCEKRNCGNAGCWRRAFQSFLGTFDIAGVLCHTKLVTADVPECRGLPTAGLQWS